MGSPGFAGRAAELAAVTSALRAASAGRVMVTFVSGVAGQGKSRFAAEIETIARGEGFAVAWGRCRETVGSPPYWPWTQVLRSLRASGRLEGIDSETLADVAPVLLEPSRESSRANDAFRVCDATTRILSEGSQQPLLVVLDDLHRADPASLELLGFVIDALAAARVAVVATYRDDEIDAHHRLRAIVAAAVTSMHVRLLPLPGLSQDEIADAVSHLTGSVLDATHAERLLERTGGNPFFVTELARLGLDGSGLDGRIPVSVREAVRARVQALPAPTRSILSVAAVLGRDFGGDLLDRISSASRVSVIGALQPAATAAVIVADADREGRYRFVHALVQEVVYGDLEEAVRRSLHARATAVLDALPPADRSTHLDELAHHAAAAIGDPAGRARAARIAREAGERARDMLAFDDAASWFLRSLELAPDDGPIPLMLECAGALARSVSHRVDEAREAYEAALEMALTCGDLASAGRAALGIGDVVASAGAVDYELVRTLESVELALSAEFPVLAIECAARRAIELYWLADRGVCRLLAADALRRARSGPDVPSRVLGEAMHAMRYVLRGPDDLQRRIDLGQQLVDLAVRTSDHELALRAYCWLIPDRLTAGDVAGTDAAIDALDKLEAKVRRPLARWYVLVFRALRAAFGGVYDDALELSDEAGALGRRIGTQPAALYHTAQRAVVMRDLGHHDTAIAEILPMVAQFPQLVTLRCELALLYAEANNPTAARAHLDPLARTGFSAVPRDSLWLTSIALAAVAAARLGDEQAATTALTLVSPYQGRNLVQGVPNSFGAVDLALGSCHRLLGDAESAVAHLESAVDLHRRWGAQGFHAESMAELAAALVARGRSADAGRAHALAVAAGAEAERLGMRRTLGPPPARRATRAERGLTLSRREEEILGLVAGGAANKEIARTLRISVHTVERHVANLYAKLGVRNRAEAAAFAVSRESAEVGDPADAGT